MSYSLYCNKCMTKATLHCPNCDKTEQQHLQALTILIQNQTKIHQLHHHLNTLRHTHPHLITQQHLNTIQNIIQTINPTTTPPSPHNN